MSLYGDYRPMPYHDARKAHERNPRRAELLHAMYAAVGRMNDAVMAGDRAGYERELGKLTELRGRIAQEPV